MLTQNGKDWIAQKFGINNCYVDSGLTWTVYDTQGNSATYSGGTADIVGQLTMTQLIDRIVLNGVTYRYSDLKAANDGQDISYEDVQWIAQNDGSAGEPQYCYQVTAPPPTGKGWLLISSFPGGATVKVDGNVIGTSPEAPQYMKYEVDAGTHTIEYELNGYEKATLIREVKEGETVDAFVLLEPIPGGPVATAVLTVRAYKKDCLDAGHSKEDCEVSAEVKIYGISGEERYLTPVSIRLARDKTYKVTVYYPGYEPYETTVELTQDKTIEAELEKAKLWVEVEIGERPAWITSFNIDRWINYGAPFEAYVRIAVTATGTYYFRLKFHQTTPEFEASLDIRDIGPQVGRTFESEHKELTPFSEDTKIVLTGTIASSDEIPPGKYVAVAELWME